MGNTDSIGSASTLRITTYITTATNSIDEDAIGVALAQWLDFDPGYVRNPLVAILTSITYCRLLSRAKTPFFFMS